MVKGKRKKRKGRRRKNRGRGFRGDAALSLSIGRGLLARSSRMGTAPHIITLLLLW
jgi:hypothetical protein